MGVFQRALPTRKLISSAKAEAASIKETRSTLNAKTAHLGMFLVTAGLREMTTTRMNKDTIKIEVDALWTKDMNPRLVQVFPYGEVNEEHCVHGIKLRWSCDRCEDLLDAKPTMREG